ncbi:MAG TPA: hypothetical protein VE173_01845 [Longimicrobiales bacterium]|jgi:hypothetical protein|nr:hypothetical protein [Longimicrobiales bacterium]
MYRWMYHDRSGEEIGASHHFEDPEAAEEWLSACWPDLHANGVEEVALLDGGRGRQVYRMGLGQL